MMPPIVVAIPVRDEALLIGDCLRAISLQQTVAPPDILLLVNNSSDGTAEIARSLCPLLPSRIHVLEHSFAAEQANAGHARCMAMEEAARRCAPDGILLTTDADGCVPGDWIALNLAALSAGADVVCGRAVIDPIDALRIPPHLHEDDALEVAYALALERLTCLLDPDPHDPWPRHPEESGASIAVRLASFRKAGGVPPVRSGEDRALVEALRRVDVRIRHDPEVVVTVSGRTVGRAAGGMAETIGRRIRRQDPNLDDALEPVADRIRRVAARRLFRQAWGQEPTHRARATEALLGSLNLRRDRLADALSIPFFGAAWSLLEASSEALRRQPVPRTRVLDQTREAEAFLEKEKASGLF